MLQISTPRERIRVLSLIFIASSILCWGWALANTLTKGLDIGTFIFLLSFSAGWGALKAEQSPTFEGALYAGYAVRFATLFAVCMYAFNIYFDHRIGYQVYCGVAAVLWALGGWVLTRELWRADDNTPSADAQYIYTSVPADSIAIS